MQEINNYIKENDTDNVTLNKLKELAMRLLDIEDKEDIQGETIADVLNYITQNIVGGDNYLRVLNTEGLIDGCEVTTNGYTTVAILGGLPRSFSAAYGHIMGEITVSKATTSIDKKEIFKCVSTLSGENVSLKGVIPVRAQIGYTNQYCMGIIRFQNGKAQLILNDKTFLTTSSVDLRLEFNGVVRYLVF